MVYHFNTSTISTTNIRSCNTNISFSYCSCKGAHLLKNCLYCAEARECDPDLCHKCDSSLFLDVANDFNPIIKS